MTHYETLQVARTATKELIRRAYLAQAKKVHPDVNPSSQAKMQFQKIQEAYGVLSNELKRKDYDQTLTGSPGSTGSTGSAGSVREEQWMRRGGRRTSFRYSEYAGFPGGERGYARFNERMDEQEARREYEQQMDEMRRNQNFSQAELEYKELLEVLKKAVPVFLPVVVVLMIAMYGMTRKEKEKFKVLYDNDGNAFIEDAFGRVTRFQPYDRH